jgi:hypothetical protein
MNPSHKDAVLAACKALTAAGHTIISANTDERGTPQIFAQSETGQLAFYLVRPTGHAPTQADIDQFLALARHHTVAAFSALVPADSTILTFTLLQESDTL